MTQFRRYAGRAISRLLGLPPQKTSYTVRHGLRVPMRDGVELVADHYAPDTGPDSEAAGTLLVRGPYGRRFPFSAVFAQVYASRGYHVVLQSVRGTFGSGGEFTPMVHEIADGADTVAWLREQPWFTGSFATVGLSYLGFTQWALLTDPPPEMKAAAGESRNTRLVTRSIVPRSPNARPAAKSTSRLASASSISVRFMITGTPSRKCSPIVRASLYVVGWSVVIW